MKNKNAHKCQISYSLTVGSLLNVDCHWTQRNKYINIFIYLKFCPRIMGRILSSVNCKMCKLGYGVLVYS